MKLKKLYELPEYQNIKLYFDDLIDNKNDIVVIFDHLDGLYSYCWLDGEKDKIVHISVYTEFVEYKDGYKILRGEK